MFFHHISSFFYCKYSLFIIFIAFFIQSNCEKTPDYKELYYKAAQRITELESKLNNITTLYQVDVQNRMENIQNLITQIVNTPASELNCQKKLSDLSMDLSKIIFERDNCVFQMNLLNSSLSYYKSILSPSNNTIQSISSSSTNSFQYNSRIEELEIEIDTLTDKNIDITRSYQTCNHQLLQCRSECTDAIADCQQRLLEYENKERNNNFNNKNGNEERVKMKSDIENELKRQEHLGFDEGKSNPKEISLICYQQAEVSIHDLSCEDKANNICLRLNVDGPYLTSRLTILCDGTVKDQNFEEEDSEDQ